MSGRLEVIACRREVSGWAAAGRNGVGLASANRVNVQAVQAGGEYACLSGLDGNGGVSTGEVDGGVGDVLAVGGIQLCFQLIGTRTR